MAGRSEASGAAGLKRASALDWLLPVVALTFAAAGGGALIGTQILAAAKGASATEPAGSNPFMLPTQRSVVRELAPIVTNLAAPDGSWIRLQTAIVYDRSQVPQVDLMAAKIGDDILAYVKTLTVAQIQGASGLQQLREDLNERVATRSEGHVRELMIEMMVVQ